MKSWETRTCLCRPAARFSLLGTESWEAEPATERGIAERAEGELRAVASSAGCWCRQEVGCRGFAEILQRSAFGNASFPDLDGRRTLGASSGPRYPAPPPGLCQRVAVEML